MTRAEEVAKSLDDRAIAGGWNTRCYPEFVFEQPELNRLSALWHEKAQSLGRLPSRADFEARELRSILSNLMIIEKVGAPNPRYRIRYFGTVFVPFFGEQTGRYFDEFVPAPNLPRWTMIHDAVLESGAPLCLTSEFQIPALSYLTGEGFSAPLANGSDAPHTTLAAMYFKPKLSRRIAV